MPDDKTLAQTTSFITKAATNKSLFDYDVVCDQKQQAVNLVESYLEPIKRNKDLEEFETKNAHMGTWEKDFPNPLTRMLAIYAHEYIGSNFIKETNERPPETVGYPYKFEVSYSVVVEEQKLDGNIIRYNDYYDTFNYELNETEEKEIKSHYFTDPNVKIVEINKLFHWSIADPTTQMRLDVYIKPSKAIEFISFSGIIKPDGTFMEQVPNK